MSANELYAIKTIGAMYATGDLNDPTIVSLPMVIGSELLHAPVITGQGTVYGSRTSGVWVWPHGDNASLLSPQMNPDFWAVTPGSDLDDFGGITYQFSRCDEWLLIPNNWLYDTNINSWWRLEDENELQIRYFTSLSHFIYGSESFYTNSNNHPVHEWIRENKATSYSWQCHPLWETVDTLVDIRQVTIRAQGEGSIVLTLTGETSTSEVTFIVNSTLPTLLRQNIRLQDSNVAVKMFVTGEEEAPTIYECNVGYFEAQRGSTVQ
jgi:hypothetical protein